MADPGEGPGGQAPPPYFKIKLRPEGPKNIFGAPLPLYKGLDDLPPSLCQGLDPALIGEGVT